MKYSLVVAAGCGASQAVRPANGRHFIFCSVRKTSCALTTMISKRLVRSNNGNSNSNSSGSGNSSSTTRSNVSYLFLGTCVAALGFQIWCNCVTQSTKASLDATAAAELHTEGPPPNLKKKLAQRRSTSSSGSSSSSSGATSAAVESARRLGTFSTNSQSSSGGDSGVANGNNGNGDTGGDTVLLEKHRLGASLHNGRLRVLWGILSADFYNDQVYRKRHRNLFKLWNDPRVCSLPDFKKKSMAERYECELIYTFVLGANPKAPPELVDHSRPFEVARPILGALGKDMNEPDMTLLNIRENMNEGKSQTWMLYGAQIAEQYDLDYVAKCDADSMLHLHEFFHFAYKNMPPAPYNSMMYVGALRDKAYWPKHATEAERIRFESYFGNNYDGVHLYVAGQVYICATDLAKFIGQEALENKCSYCEGHEDHDISAIAFHAPEPVKLVVVGRSHRFWEHPVKGEPRWKRIWAREQARVQGEPFEGKIFSANSSLEAVLGHAPPPLAQWNR
jgi:Galactosyltransferase